MGEIVKEWTVYPEPKVKSFEFVKTELCKFMESKLWVLVDAANDFDSIHQTPRDYEYFDLQMEY